MGPDGMQPGRWTGEEIAEAACSAALACDWLHFRSYWLFVCQGAPQSNKKQRSDDQMVGPIPGKEQVPIKLRNGLLGPTRECRNFQLV